jgi:hypothetical protein
VPQADPWVSAGGDVTVYFGGLAADISTERKLLRAVVPRRRRPEWRPARARHWTSSRPLVLSEVAAGAPGWRLARPSPSTSSGQPGSLASSLSAYT